MASALAPEVKHALASDLTIDIVTIGAKTGLHRTTEIWFTRVDERIVICGTVGATGEPGERPKTRDWLVNLRAHPDFWFCFKESMHFCLRARAREVTDPEDRRAIWSAPATRWYRERSDSFEALVAHGPIVEVTFPE